MVDPLRQHAALIKAAQDAQRSLAPAQHLAEQLAKSSAFLATERSGLAEAIMEMQRRQEMLQPAIQVQRIISQMQAAQEMANSLGERFRTTFSAIDVQAQKWRKLVEPSVARLQQLSVATRQFSGLADSLVAWESSATRLAQRINEIGMFANRVHLSARLFAPSEAFTDFAQHTFSRIEAAKNDRQAWALETSLHLAEEQLIATTETLDSVVATPEDEDDISESRDLAAPYVQQEELVDAVENIDEEDASALVETSPAASAADLSRSILTTVATCNEARKVSGAAEIFKPTTRLLEVYSDMPWLVPVDKKSFAQFVDCLYFLFYEGAGKDKLRFLKSHGGPIADEDFDFILCIKHLRNKWTRHDADHGKDPAIAKAWMELAGKFQALGLRHMPVTTDDFRLLHVNLLSMAYEFVEKVLRGVIEHE